jgi:hypothetical protein
LRHSFATHSIENGVPIHVVQKLMGHTDISTTETYLHVSKHGATAAESPLPKLEQVKEKQVSNAEDVLRSALVAPVAKSKDKAIPKDWRIVG